MIVETFLKSCELKMLCQREFNYIGIKLCLSTVGTLQGLGAQCKEILCSK